MTHPQALALMSAQPGAYQIPDDGGLVVPLTPDLSVHLFDDSFDTGSVGLNMLSGSSIFLVDFAWFRELPQDISDQDFLAQFWEFFVLECRSYDESYADSTEEQLQDPDCEWDQEEIVHLQLQIQNIRNYYLEVTAPENFGE